MERHGGPVDIPWELEALLRERAVVHAGTRLIRYRRLLSPFHSSGDEALVCLTAYLPLSCI
jgi:hypothetical protein